MIDNIGADQMGPILGKSPLPHPDLADTRARNDADVALQVDFAGLINQAKQDTEADVEAVHKARELLLSGELICRKNLLSAAEGIINLGI